MNAPLLKKIGADLYTRVFVAKKSTIVGLAISAADVVVQALLGSSNGTVHALAQGASLLLMLYKGGARLSEPTSAFAQDDEAAAEIEKLKAGQGFITTPLALKLALAALVTVIGLAAIAARADDPVPPKFGGCQGSWCFGPSATISLMAVNVTKKTVEAGFTPGVCYGATHQPGSWSSLGAEGCFELQAAPSQVAKATLMLKFFNGWGRVGISKGFIGDHDLRIPLAIGSDF
jgi:hypothetical protein